MRQIARREDIRDLILDAVDVLLARYGYKKDDHGGRGPAGRHRQGHDLPPFPVQGGAGPVPYRPHRREGRPELRRSPARPIPAERRLRRMLVLRVLHPLRQRRPLFPEPRRPPVLGPGGPARPPGGLLRERGGGLRGRPPGRRPARGPRLPRSPNDLARPHPEHELAPSVQPLAPGARPPGGRSRTRSAASPTC